MLLFIRFSILIVIIISTREVFLLIWRHFSPIRNQALEQGQVMAAVNSRK